MAPQLGAGVGGVVGGGDAEPLAGEVARQQPAQPRVVVHHQDMRVVRHQRRSTGWPAAARRARPAARRVAGTMRRRRMPSPTAPTESPSRAAPEGGRHRRRVAGESPSPPRRRRPRGRAAPCATGATPSVRQLPVRLTQSPVPSRRLVRPPRPTRGPARREPCCARCTQPARRGVGLGDVAAGLFVHDPLHHAAEPVHRRRAGIAIGDGQPRLLALEQAAFQGLAGRRQGQQALAPVLVALAPAPHSPDPAARPAPGRATAW